MSLTSFRATIENGLIRLPADLHLADKTVVYVVVPDAEAQPVYRLASPRLAHPEDFENFRKKVILEPDNAGV